MVEEFNEFEQQSSASILGGKGPAGAVLLLPEG